ncbi:MAG: hypothetical protein IJK84_09540 [Bacteroidales bacterium]|nr:hypothetical protein [Bacteroidales bacterium]
MRKISLMVLLMMSATVCGFGQVLGGTGSYGGNSGLTLYVGTQMVNGRTFGFLDEATYTRTAVVPDSYQRQLLNPVFALGWWSEIPSDDFVFGYQVMGSYATEKYSVALGSETLSGRSKMLGLNLGCYVGWHFGSQLTACVGLQDESRMPIHEGGRPGIFESQNTLGALAVVRYSFMEDLYVSLNVGYGLLSWGGFSSDWEKYQSVGAEGYYVVETELKPFTLMVGVGKAF